MKTGDDDFRRLYASLSDEALNALVREDLTEGARQCYDDERARRGLETESGHVTTAPNAAEPEELVLAGTFTFPADAQLAQALLDSADIPSHLDNEHILTANWMWSNALGGLRLMVPASFLDQARAILQTRVSDEDLIAEAEATSGPGACLPE